MPIIDVYIHIAFEGARDILCVAIDAALLLKQLSKSTNHAKQGNLILAIIPL